MLWYHPSLTLEMHAIWVPEKTLQKLQHVQNCAARVLTGSKKFSHITPSLIDLHWLPMEQCIKFKILLIVYKTPTGSAPSYLKDELHLYIPARQLRSAHSQKLVVPRTNLKTFGDRAFYHAAPILWNNLPVDIKLAPSLSSFKATLKTYLFLWSCDWLWL